MMQVKFYTSCDAFKHFCFFHIDISRLFPPLSNADQDSSSSAVQSPRLVCTSLAKQCRVFLHNLCLLSGTCCSYIFSNCWENIDFCFFSPCSQGSTLLTEHPSLLWINPTVTATCQSVESRIHPRQVWAEAQSRTSH